MFREAHTSDFDYVYPLLAQFNQYTSREHWQRLFADYFQSGEKRCGYLMEEEGKLIGYAGVIFARRQIGQKEEKWANLTSWIIDPEYQGKGRVAHRFLKQVVEAAASLADESGYTVASFSSIPSIVRLLKKQGFDLLDSHRQVLLPIPFSGQGNVQSYFDLAAFQKDLPLADKQVSQGHQELNCQHVLLRSKAGDAYLIARRKRLRKLPFLQLHFIGNKAAFLSNIHRALPAICAHFRVAGICLDERYLGGEKLTHGIRMALGYEQVYRSKQVEAEAVDSLYSELFLLDF